MTAATTHRDTHLFHTYYVEPSLTPTDHCDCPVAAVLDGRLVGGTKKEPPFTIQTGMQKSLGSPLRFWLSVTDRDGNPIDPGIESRAGLRVGRATDELAAPQIAELNPATTAYYWIHVGATFSSVEATYPAITPGAIRQSLLVELLALGCPWTVFTVATVHPGDPRETKTIDGVGTIVAVDIGENGDGAAIQTTLQTAVQDHRVLVEAIPDDLIETHDSVVSVAGKRWNRAPFSWARGLLSPPNGYAILAQGGEGTGSVLDALESQHREKLLDGEFAICGPPVATGYPGEPVGLDAIPLNQDATALHRVGRDAYINTDRTQPLLYQHATTPGPVFVVGIDEPRLRQLGTSLSAVLLADPNTEPSVTWVDADVIETVQSRADLDSFGVPEIMDGSPAIGLYHVSPDDDQRARATELATTLTEHLHDSTPSDGRDIVGSLIVDLTNLDGTASPAEVIANIEALTSVNRIRTTVLSTYPGVSKDQLDPSPLTLPALPAEFRRFTRDFTRAFDAAVFDRPGPILPYLLGNESLDQEVFEALVTPGLPPTTGDRDAQRDTQYLFVPSDSDRGFGTPVLPLERKREQLPVSRAQVLLEEAQESGAPIVIPAPNTGSSNISPKKAERTTKQHAVRETATFSTVAFDSGHGEYVCTECRGNPETDSDGYFPATNAGLLDAVACHGSRADVDREALRQAPDVELPLAGTEIADHDLLYEQLQLLGVLRLVQTGEIDPGMEYDPARDSAITLRDDLRLDRDMIDELSDDGYIVVSTGQPHTLYTLTQKGLVALDEPDVFEGNAFASVHRLVMKRLARQLKETGVADVPGRHVETDVEVAVRSNRHWQPTTTTIDIAVMDGDDIVETVMLYPPRGEAWTDADVEITARPTHDGFDVHAIAVYRAIQDLAPERATWVVWKNASIKGLLEQFADAAREDVIRYEGGVPSDPRQQSTNPSEPGINGIRLVSGIANDVDLGASEVNW